MELFKIVFMGEIRKIALKTGDGFIGGDFK